MSDGDVMESNNVPEDIRRLIETLRQDDVRELRRIHSELREAETRFEQIADAIGDVVWITGWTTHGVLFASPAYEKIWGRSVEALYKDSRDWIDGVHPDDRPRVEEAFSNIAASGGFDETFRVVRPDGTIRRVRDRGYPIRDDQGNIYRIAGVASDITAQHETEISLRKLSRAIEQSASIVIVTDVQGNIEYVNPRFTEVTGYAADEAMGANPRILKSGRHRHSFYRNLWDTIASGNTWRGELCNRKRNGELYWESASISPVRNTRGQITHFVAVKEDVTEARAAAQELEHARDAAEAANRAKSEFLANMSHELRTPLNAIIGFSEVLTDRTFGELNEKQDRHVGHILSSGRHLLALINDILDLSKVEAGKLELDREAVDLGRLLDEALILVREKAAKHRIRIELNVDERLAGRTLLADGLRLKQVVYNLLSNAARFTPDGGCICVGAEPADNGAAKAVRVSVSDTGLGVRPEDQERIFREFEQADAPSGESAVGTGLGLSLCKRFVELHGGRIWVESEGHGKGSTFAFEIPWESGDGDPGEG